MNKEDFLKKTPLFSFLPEKELTEINRNFSATSCKKNEYIFFEGDPCEALYILLDGRIKIVKQGSGGREIILEIISPGEFFGAVALISDSPLPASAIAVGQGAFLKLPKKVFFSLRAKYPGMNALFTETLGRRLLSAHNYKKTISHDTAEVRLANAILKLHKEMEDGEGHIKITRKELAELVGTTVETTIRTLSRFTRDGAIVSTRGKISVSCPGILKKIAEKES